MRTDSFKGQEKKMLFWEDGDNSIDVKNYMIQHSLSCIVFSKYLGFKGDAVIIHEPYEFVEEVHIIDSNIRDISFINNFFNANKLNIQNTDRTKFDISHFGNLENLFLTWRKGVGSLFGNKNLKILRLEYYKEKILEEISDDMMLEELWISNSPIENLSGLARLKNIKTLHLDYLRCMEDSSWIKNIVSLEELNIGSCKKMSKTIFDNITELNNLKKIFFTKMGEFPSIASIQNLQKLETVGFIEDSKITDGNLIPLLELPNLNKIYIQGFKHYHPTVIDLKKHHGIS